MTENKHKKNSFVIFVNKKQIKVEEDKILGKEILSLAGFSSDQYDLFLVRGQESQKIEPEQSIELQNGLRFNAILRDVPYGNDS